MFQSLVLSLFTLLPCLFLLKSELTSGNLLDRCAETLGEWVCGAHPVVQVNVLFFANVTVLFWLVGLLQGR